MYLIILLGVVLFLSSGLVQADDTVAVYDKDWQVESRIKDGTIYSKDWKVKGHIRDGRIYDKDWRSKGYIENNQGKSNQVRRSK
jgi:hypothetical protein